MYKYCICLTLIRGCNYAIKLKYIFKEGECDVDVHNQLTKSVGCQVEKVKKRSKYCQTSLKEKKSGSTSVVKMVDAGKINLFFYLSCIRALIQDFHLKGEDGLNLTSQKMYLLTVINVFNAKFCLFFGF